MKLKVTAILVVIAAAAALVGAWFGGWFVESPAPPADTPPDVAVSPPPVQPAVPAPVPPMVTVAPPAPPPAPVPQPMITTPGGPKPPTSAAPPSAPPAQKLPPDIREQARAEIDTASLMFRDYRTIMSENPVGTNAEIMKAINGGNPKGARLMHEGQQLNGNGELVDQWGTPYFFHQMSATSMEITSAGPDKILGTPDDITGR